MKDHKSFLPAVLDLLAQAGALENAFTIEQLRRQDHPDVDLDDVFLSERESDYGFAGSLAAMRALGASETMYLISSRGYRVGVVWQWRYDDQCRVFSKTDSSQYEQIKAQAAQNR